MANNNLLKSIMRRGERISSYHKKKHTDTDDVIESIALICAIMERHAAELCRSSKEFISISNSVIAGATSLDAYNELANKLQAQISLTWEQIQNDREEEEIPPGSEW